MRIEEAKLNSYLKLDSEIALRAIQVSFVGAELAGPNHVARYQPFCKRLALPKLGLEGGFLG